MGPVGVKVVFEPSGAIDAIVNNDGLGALKSPDGGNVLNGTANGVMKVDARGEHGAGSRGTGGTEIMPFLK